jgi:hypothetical protein
VFSHSSAIATLDDTGRPIARAEGLGHADELAAAVAARR